MKQWMNAIIISMLSLLSLTSIPAHAQVDFNSDVWKNEGIYTPLTPFTSFDWSSDIHYNFDSKFSSWANGMGQSYYQILDETEIADSGLNPVDHTFQGFDFKEIVKNAYVDGYKVGFTYQDRDYRSDFDSKRYDVFRVYGSSNPDQKHLYIFAVEVETGEPIVFYIDGDTMVEGERFEIKETANEELKSLFQEVMVGDQQASTSQTTVDSDGYIITNEAFMQLSLEEQGQMCTVTPWHQMPNATCSDKGMLPDGHWELARQYGRETGAGVDEAIMATQAEYQLSLIHI